MDSEDLKARLLKPRLGEDTVEIDGVGMVRVRALTRAEVLRITPLKMAAREREMLVLGMVEPRMSEDDVRAWTKASPSGELEKVTICIAKLSGLTVAVEKKVYQEFEEEDGAEFRLLPSAGAGRDDSGRDEGTDD